MKNLTNHQNSNSIISFTGGIIKNIKNMMNNKMNF